MNAKSCLIAIKPVGTFVAVQKLRAMLEVKPRSNETDLQKRSEMIYEEVYKRLIFYSKPENSIDDPFTDYDDVVVVPATENNNNATLPETETAADE
uniref:Uncharacterized protein n=1 Tax=Panagrolaimus sp. ES5 TaxID=591445 RepID=A0AC34FTR4_9BILA